MNMSPSLMIIVSFILMFSNISIVSTSEWEIQNQSVKFPNFWISAPTHRWSGVLLVVLVLCSSEFP